MADIDSPFLYFVGTAGSGKTTLVAAFDAWCKRNGVSTTIVNLDPGAEDLPYSPDVDIREWFTVRGMMKEHGLGPNGAQLAAADMLALHAEELRRLLEEYKQDYVLVDTPGQIELFGFRSSSQVLLNTLSPSHALIIFLLDPNLVSTPTGFISSNLLWATIASRFLVPSIGVLAKSDMVDKEVLENVFRWSENTDVLQAAALQQGQNMNTLLSNEMFKSLEVLGAFKRVTPSSSIDLVGMEDIYTAVQDAFSGGEDIGE